MTSLIYVQSKLAICLAEVAQAHRRADHYKLRIQTEAYTEDFGRVVDGHGSALSLARLLQHERDIHHAHIHKAEQLLEQAKGYLAQIADLEGVR